MTDGHELEITGHMDVPDAVQVHIVRISRLRGVLIECRMGTDPPVRRWLREGDTAKITVNFRFDGHAIPGTNPPPSDDDRYNPARAKSSGPDRPSVQPSTR